MLKTAMVKAMVKNCHGESREALEKHSPCTALQSEP